MRLFVGIKASESLKKRVRSWRNEYNNLPIRFVVPENLHVTLIPPWYEKSPDKVVKLLSGCKFNRFNISFDRIYINNRNKVIWLEATGYPEEFIALQNDIFEKLGKDLPRRELIVHVTLGRLRDSKIFKNIKLKNLQLEESAENITLFESVLKSNGVEYKVIYQKNLLPISFA